jgi:3-hydroxyisobutyrate dehydrogenase
MPNEAQTNTRIESQSPSVTVIGAGTMGSAVAGRLLGAGMTVGVWDRTPRTTLVGLGATAFDDPRSAVKAATVVVTLLPTAEAVTDVMVGQGVVDAMAPQAIWVQMGTIGAEAIDALDAEVRVRRPDIRFVDAPVSGSRHPAETGQLLVLASGPESTVATLEPVFSAVGRRTLWLGPAGQGSRLKLVLNTWLAFEVEAAAEAAALATRLGIAPQILEEAVDGNPLASPLASAKLSKMELADDQPEFALEWALKDLDLMNESVGARFAPVAVAIAERWRPLVQQGFGKLDVSAARLGLGAEPPDNRGAS